MYQRQDNQWQDVKYEIDDLATSDDLLTHATFCAEKGNEALCSMASSIAKLESRRHFVAGYSHYR